MDGGALLLDVREPEEWCTEHAPTAMLLPVGRVRSRQHELPRDRRIVVVCRSGGRSAVVTTSLRRSGFDAVNLAGGMCAWAAAGLPVIRHGVNSGLVVHREDPLNCETSLPELIGGVVMPSAHFYVRNHFTTPVVDPERYELTVTGMVAAAVAPSACAICAACRRSRSSPRWNAPATAGISFDPPVAGEQWRFGAASAAEWTGVPLVEIFDGQVWRPAPMMSCSAAPTRDWSRVRRHRCGSSIPMSWTMRGGQRRTRRVRDER